ncbi:hypothetical protein TIFTF001_011612 [Ficus carica]|uniref:Uncharacterized protein n=1 Tax=Ficus carica TaxID=3494 RepID=A0AA87ZYZ1_FICCA|nr:hypothetical protein TIFTF001_011612 [Ficus carica]
MGRPPCCDKSNVKRGLWTAEEDAKILAHVSKHGVGNWTSVPMKAGLNRCGKSCRLRWTNYLRPDLNHNDFTPQEEEHIVNLHQAIGSRWSLIAKQLPGRTDNDVKNHWNTKLRKKLSKMGIDPITHKPISQILSEYGNISGLVNSGNHIAARSLDNIFIPKSESSSVIRGFPPPNMIISPTMEQVPSNNSFSSAFNPSLEFLSKVQVINKDTVQPHFFNEVTSSCSSSSSPHVTPSSSSLNWSEFLLLDPSELAEETPEEEQESELQGLLSSTNAAAAQEFANGGDQFGDQFLGGQGNNKTENSSPNSFVDTILDRDSELKAAFPQFLDGSFEYYCAYLDDRHLSA